MWLGDAGCCEEHGDTAGCGGVLRVRHETRKGGMVMQVAA